MIGTTTSLPLPVVSPAADGSGVGAIVGGTTVAAADGATVALEPGVGLADGVAAADGATATVNVHVPRASSPSSSETVVHWTTYEPEPSGVAGVATICLALLGSTPPVATVPPPTSLTTRLLPLGFTRSTKVPPTTVTGWVTVALSAGVGVSSCACALARVATSGTSRKAAATAAARRPNPNCRMMSGVYKRSVQPAEIAAHPAAIGVVHADPVRRTRSRRIPAR